MRTWVGRDLEPPADDRAEHGGDDRQAAELDPVERLVPAARVAHGALGVALHMLRQVEAGAEMPLGPRQHGDLHARRRRAKEGVDPVEKRVAHRVALGRAVHGQDGDAVGDVDLQHLIGHRSPRHFGGRRTAPSRRMVVPLR
jgi:hypothetical protein